MSDKRSSASAAGLIGAAIAGGAVLAAACYAAYETWFHQPPVPCNPPQRRESITRDTRSSCCKFCDGDLISEETIHLPCEHSFHKLCLQANYILHMNQNEQYKCPTCHVPVPTLILNSLSA